MNSNTTDEQFIKGYNEGYLLSKFEPLILKQIIRAHRENDPHLEGIKAGHKAHEKEMFDNSLKRAQAINNRSRGKTR